MADIEIVTENMTELLTNTVNMTSIFYDLFISDVPMDIELTQFDKDNVLRTFTLPNRAKDREQFAALVGNGNPEGLVDAALGMAYFDKSSDRIYYKTTPAGEVTGWKVVLTETGAEEYFRKYLNDNKFVTETTLGRYLLVNNYATHEYITNVLEDYTPKIRMSETVGTSGNIALYDNQCYYITPTEDTTFALPAVSDLSFLHNILVQIEITEDFINGNFSIDYGTEIYFDHISPDFSKAGNYNLMYEYDVPSGAWVCGWMTKGRE